MFYVTLVIDFYWFFNILLLFFIVISLPISVILFESPLDQSCPVVSSDLPCYLRFSARWFPLTGSQTSSANVSIRSLIHCALVWSYNLLPGAATASPVLQPVVTRGRFQQSSLLACHLCPSLFLKCFYASPTNLCPVCCTVNKIYYYSFNFWVRSVIQT